MCLIVLAYRFGRRPFIVSPIYGTRSSTVAIIGKHDLLLEERSFDAAGNPAPGRFTFFEPW